MKVLPNPLKWRLVHTDNDKLIVYVDLSSISTFSSISRTQLLFAGVKPLMFIRIIIALKFYNVDNISFDKYSKNF